MLASKQCNLGFLVTSTQVLEVVPPSGYSTRREADGATMKKSVLNAARHHWDPPPAGPRQLPSPGFSLLTAL